MRPRISHNGPQTAWRPPPGHGNGPLKPGRIAGSGPAGGPGQKIVPGGRIGRGDVCLAQGRRVVRFGPGFGPGSCTARWDGNAGGLFLCAAQHVVHRRFRSVVLCRLLRPRPYRRVPPCRLAPCLGGNSCPVRRHRPASHLPREAVRRKDPVKSDPRAFPFHCLTGSLRCLPVNDPTRESIAGEYNMAKHTGTAATETANGNANRNLAAMVIAARQCQQTLVEAVEAALLVFFPPNRMGMDHFDRCA